MVRMLGNHYYYNSLIQCMNTHQTSPRLLNFAISMQYAEKNDLYQVLELLHVSQDMQVQVKLFSILAVYLVSNGTHSDMIIKFNPLYDKICAVLARGLPQKTNVTLNFITALLYTDIEEATRRRVLVAYAQNMLRTSGCLTAMANLFTACMIQQETWRALCQCLAETCDGMAKNQSYCSHLVPLCVRRCNQGSEYVFQLLQSLLHNHEHNMQLFYETGGHNVFSREFLKYDQCLQLLSTVISKPDYKIKLLEETNIFAELKDLKRLYGISSEVGQWATVILYTINNTTKAPETCKGLGEEPKVNDDVRDRNYVRDNKVSSNNYTKSQNITSAPDLNVNNCGNDTSELFQNVIREVLNFEPRLKTGTSTRINKPNINIKTNPLRSSNQIIYGVEDFSKDKTILKNTSNVPKPRDAFLHPYLLKRNSDKKYNLKNNNIQNVTKFITTQNNKLTKNYLNLKETKTNYNDANGFNKTPIKDTIVPDETIINFRPTFVSTPKVVHRTDLNGLNMSYVSKRYSLINKKYKNSIQRSRIESKIKTDNKNNRSERHRSIGARLFDVINESCTTLVKTVKNVFKTKRAEKSPANISSKSNDDDSYKTHRANSFTSYMRKRDAYIKGDRSSNWDESQNECFTCNDTLSLKQKFLNDDLLKENVKRLKLGINLYGCDFKKISKTLWRNENYMTPSVLYNLYRKLIVK